MTMATGSMAAVRHDAVAVAKILHVIRDREREIGRQGGRQSGLLTLRSSMRHCLKQQPTPPHTHK